MTVECWILDNWNSMEESSVAVEGVLACFGYSNLAVSVWLWNKMTGTRNKC